MSILLNRVIQFADEHYDGQFTLMKTNTRWHACYGIVEDREPIPYIHSGNSMDEVLQELIEDPIDASGVRKDEDHFDFHQFKDVYAIKINDKVWLNDYTNPERERVYTFSTEKKALKEAEYFKKQKEYTDLDFKVINVEEEIFIHLKKGIDRQTIRELEKK